MIDFSRDADYASIKQRSVEKDSEKKKFRSGERAIRVNYDFADRDKQSERDNKQAVYQPEPAKVEPISTQTQKFDRNIGKKTYYSKNDDFELTK